MEERGLAAMSGKMKTLISLPLYHVLEVLHGPLLLTVPSVTTRLVATATAVLG
jgi:hypothetical protein